jgi:hypothetical protein
MTTEYRYVETSTVTDEELTRLVNANTHEGWHYEGVQFAMRESSKRPAMAFLLFTRPEQTLEEEAAPILDTL